MDLIVTSTALTENDINQLKLIIDGNCPNTKYCSDLTSDVKVLVINQNDPQKHWLKSKKFMYVVGFRPDVKVIDSNEVFKFYENNQIDFSFAMFDQIKPFASLSISLSRIEESLLDKIKKVIETNGGKAVDHLTNESDLMISMMAEGKRFDAAIKWGIPVVSPDWCYDSIERGLSLNFTFYELLTNVTGLEKKYSFRDENDKVGSESLVKTYNLGKRDRACDWDKLNEWKAGEHVRKLEEYIRNKNVKTNREKSNREIRENSKSNNSFTSNDDSYTVLNESSEIDINLKRKIDLLSKNDESDDKEDKIVKVKRKNLGNGLWDSFIHKEKQEASKPILNKFQNKEEKRKGPILGGLKFKTFGFSNDEDRKLNKIIKKFGGEMFPFESSVMVNFTVINYKYNGEINDFVNPITEFAIERFIFNEKVDSGDYFWCKHFTIPESLEIEQFKQSILQIEDDGNDNDGGKDEDKEEINDKKDKKLQVCITGFQGTDLSQIERILQNKLSKWVEFNQTLTQKCELLVIGVNNTPTVWKVGSAHKEHMANRWNIPVLLIEDFHSRVLDINNKSYIKR